MNLNSGGARVPGMTSGELAEGLKAFQRSVARDYYLYFRTPYPRKGLIYKFVCWLRASETNRKPSTTARRTALRYRMPSNRLLR